MPHITSAPLALLLVAVLAYLLGSVPFGIVITRALGLGDLRKIGSVSYTHLPPVFDKHFGAQVERPRADGQDRRHRGRPGAVSYTHLLPPVPPQGLAMVEQSKPDQSTSVSGVLSPVSSI